jgi:large subunit ribosomal protein L1
MKKTKRRKEIEKIVDLDESSVFSIDEAIEIIKKCPAVKFDETVELSLKMGLDPRKSDQQVRGTLSLPKGTGKTLKVLVFAKGDKIKEAEAAGADFVGNDDLIEKVKHGWTSFDAVVATPDMMREVGKLGKVLGPRGLMPTPRAGTVSQNVEKAVRDLKAGKIEFKLDKNALINNIVGKLSFNKESLTENIKALINAINRAKPAGAKGVYMKSLHISSTMGPGVKIDLQSIVL